MSTFRVIYIYVLHHSPFIFSTIILHVLILILCLNRYIGRIIYNQVMSVEEVDFGLFNQSEPVYNNVVLPNASPFDEGFAQQNQSYDVDSVSAEQWPEPLHTREARKDKRKVSFCPPVPAVKIQRLFGENPACLSCIAEDASSLAWVASLHGCTHTCTKYGKKGPDGLPLPGAECRFGFGVDGKPILERGSVKNGRAVVYSDGTLEIDGVRVEVDGPNDQTAALELQREIDRAIRARAKAVEDNVPFEDGDDDFLIRVRRGSTHINSYNWVVQQAIRSNMDIKVR